MTTNQPGLTREYRDYPDERISEAYLELIVRCHDEHLEGCPCRLGGDEMPREIVIEDHDGYVVVADLA